MPQAVSVHACCPGIIISRSSSDSQVYQFVKYSIQEKIRHSIARPSDFSCQKFGFLKNILDFLMWPRNSKFKQILFRPRKIHKGQNLGAANF